MDAEQLALLEMYKEHAAQARQHETQRQQMTALVVAIAAALVGFVAANLKNPSGGLLVPGIFLIFLGVSGAALHNFLQLGGLLLAIVGGLGAWIASKRR